MQEAITNDRVRATCRLPVKTLCQFSFTMEPNKHAEAEITCILDLTEYSLEQVLDMLNEDAVEFIAVASLNQDGTCQNIFCGIIQQAEVTYEGQLAMLFVRAISATYLLDIERKTRSFQQTSQTYRQLVDEIIGEHPGADMVWEAEDRPIGCPLIQYQETDWEFIKRIASHLHTSLMPEASTKHAHFFVGLTIGDVKGNLQYNVGIWSVQGRYVECRDYSEDFVLGRHFFYEIESMEFCQIGDRFLTEKGEYAVCAILGEVRDGFLKFTYRLSGNSYYERKEYYNDALKGLSFLGKVLQTKEEVMKLHLDMDEVQEEGTAYFYPWKPLTGNLLYYMPEIGTKVGLHLPEADERKAICTYSVRENGECYGAFLQAPENLVVPDERKYLTTLHGKQLYHDPKQITMKLHGKENTILQLADEMGIKCNTEAGVVIMAEEKVELSGRKIILSAKQEATLVRKDIVAPTVVNICNAFDAIGATCGYSSTRDLPARVPPSGETLRKKAAKPETVAAILPSMLRSVPMDIVEDETARMILGSFPVINRVGAVASTSKYGTRKWQ